MAGTMDNLLGYTYPSVGTIDSLHISVVWLLHAYYTSIGWLLHISVVAERHGVYSWAWTWSTTRLQSVCLIIRESNHVELKVAESTEP